MRIHDANPTTVTRTTAKDLAGPKAKSTAEASSASSAAGATTVSLSAKAQELASGSARVDALRAKIQDGTYKVDAQAIANKLVGE